MRKGFLLSVLALLCSIALFASNWPLSDRSRGNDDKYSQMMNHLNFLEYVFGNIYAPYAWKQHHLGWDLKQEIAHAKRQINENTSLTEYHQIVRRFIQSMQDFHVQMSCFATEAAALPFEIIGADGRYFIRSYDEDTYLNFRKNDELITWNGLPIHEVVKALCEENIGSFDNPTNVKFAECMLTRRFACQGIEVPHGETVLTLRRAGRRRPVVVACPWEYGREEVIEPFSDKKLLEKYPARNVLEDLPVLGGGHKRRWVKNLVSSSNEDISGASLFAGQAVLWRDKDQSFDARIVLTDDDWDDSDWEMDFNSNTGSAPESHRVGYIRLNSYGHSSEKKYDKQVKKLAALLMQFQSETDLLVIDQRNNPGGDLLYVYAILSMLTDRPLEVIPWMQAMDHADVMKMVWRNRSMECLLDQCSTDEEIRLFLGDSKQGYPVTLQFVKNLVENNQLLIDQWQQGLSCSNLCDPAGIHVIEPHDSVNYTKPILVLINETDLSGADFFPALLQDNKRAILFGARTAGAGGCVKEVQFPNGVGIANMSYTASLALRKNGDPIENLGVTPDVSYHITPEDIRTDMQGYRSAVLKTIHRMLSE